MIRCSFSCNNINFAEERVTPGIIGFRGDDVKEQVTEPAERAAGITDAYPVLTAGITFFWPGVHGGEQFPAARDRIRAAVRLSIELWIAAVAGKHVIELRGAASRMP